MTNIEELAKDIAERLYAIEAKENAVAEISKQIAIKQEEIRLLVEEKRATEQLIQSERYVISERLGKKEAAKVLDFERK